MTPLAWVILWSVVMAIFFAFSFVIIFGAPYLPTLKDQVPKALDLIDLQPNQTLLELGSGDGRVLIEAAKRDINCIGYELNPLLFLYSWLRTRRYSNRVKLVYGNYWNRKLPKADGIFVFLLQPYMEKLDKKIIQEYSQTVKLVSFAFVIKSRKPVKKSKGLYLYLYN